MNNSKTVKISVAFAISVVIAVIMAATSVVCVALGTDSKSDNCTYLKDAKNAVSEFVSNESYNNYTFMDGLFAKANIISVCADEQTDADAAAAITKNLGLNSFIVTDSDGKIISSTDADKIGKSILDDENTNQFKKVLKGIAYKSTTEPKAVKGESGIYNVMACVTRSTGGVVIINIDTDTYTSVTGENLADNCKGDTLIAKDGKIISSNFDIKGANELESLGVKEDMLSSGAFTITVDDIKYTFSAENVEGYTVISGTVIEENGFNYVFGVAIPTVVCVVMIVLVFIVLTIAGKKNKIQ